MKKFIKALLPLFTLALTLLARHTIMNFCFDLNPTHRRQFYRTGFV